MHVDQTPSQLDKTAYANTHFKFFFALDERNDIHKASGSLLLDGDQKEWLAKLPPGQCICRYGTHDAFLLSLDSVDSVKHRIVSDEDIRRRMERIPMKPKSETADQAKARPNPSVSSQAKDTLENRPENDLIDFLACILKRPFAGLYEHYKRQRQSKYQGEKLKAQAQEQGLIRPHDVSLPAGGRVTILDDDERVDKIDSLVRSVGL